MVERRRLAVRPANRPERKRKPFRYRHPTDPVHRRSLLRRLAEEYTYGDSVCKLYAGLLAHHLVTLDDHPKTKEAWEDSLRCFSCISYEKA